MTKPFVGQGWAKSIEPVEDMTFCHMWEEDDSDFEFESDGTEEVVYDENGEPIS